MADFITIYKGCTKVLPIHLNYDISGEDVANITSQIRKGRTKYTDLIAEWVVSFATDGKDGILLLTLDDSVTALITEDVGFFDIKQVSYGEPVPIFQTPFQVVFQDLVTE